MEAITAAVTAVLGLGTSALTWITGNPVLALSIGFPLVAGSIGIIRRVV